MVVDWASIFDETYLRLGASFAEMAGVVELLKHSLSATDITQNQRWSTQSFF
jgi:hypothetical protein